MAITVKQIHDSFNLGDAQVGDYFVGQKSSDDTITGTLNFAPKLSMDPAPILTANLTLNGKSLIGNLSVNNFNNGTGASSSTFLRGDGTWQTAGSGTVNSGLINQLAWYAASGTTVSGLPTSANGVLSTNGSSVPSISTTLPNGLAMQTPASLTLTNATGLPIGGISATGTPSGTTFLRGDGTWSVAGAGGTPGGSTTQVQYNNAGSFGGDSGFTTNGSGTLSVTTQMSVANLRLNGNTLSATNVNGNILIVPASGGAVAIGGSVTPRASLDLQAQTFRGGITTDATNKNLFCSIQNFNNADGAFGYIQATAVSAGNSVSIGGGSGAFNAATTVNIFAGATPTTLTGTNIANFTINGMQIGSGMRVNTVINDGTMATATTANLSTSTAIKTYVDTGIASGVNPATGIKGEVVSSGSSTPMTTATTTNVESISLTAGIWLVTGYIQANPAAGTTFTFFNGGISTTSATIGNSSFRMRPPTGGSTFDAGLTFSVPTTRLNISTTTTVYLCARVDFSVSTLSCLSSIVATRYA